MSLRSRILGSYGPALLREVRTLGRLQNDIFMSQKTSIHFLRLIQKVETERKTAVWVAMEEKE